MSGPLAPEPDDKDWTWVLRMPCPDCGFDASALPHADIPATVRRAVASLRQALDADAASVRPAPQVWSPLEYACHVRDVCRIFGRRLQRMLEEHDPLFENWDQDASALADRYWAQQPAVVARELDDSADQIAAAFAAVPDSAWQRPGRRSNGSAFTVESLGRYFVHDLVHHAHDVGADR